MDTLDKADICERTAHGGHTKPGTEREARQQWLDAPETVYFMYSAGRIKIGYTTNILARLSNLRNMAGAQVDLIAAFPASHAIEQSLHRRFKTDRLHGEWFRVSDEIRAFLRSLDQFAEFADFLGTATERLDFAENVFAGKYQRRSLGVPVRA